MRTHFRRSIAFLAAGLIAAGCARERAAHVTVRLTDRLYASASAPGGNTARYPYATIASQTRLVLSAPYNPSVLLSRSHAAVDVDLVPGSVLDFGFGVRVDEAFESDVEFVVAVKTASGVKTLFDRVVPSPGLAANVWHDARVDLQGLRGQATLAFATASTAIRGDSKQSRVNAYFSEPVIVAPGRPAENRPNVVLISLDTLSAMHLGLYGYERDTAPQLERIFRREGVIVDRFYANAVTTERSHATMMTGCLPSAVFDPIPLSPIVPRALTLAEVLRGAGYRTAAFTEDAWVGAAFGFRRGFEIYNEETGFDLTQETRGYIEQTLSRGLQWLEQHRDQPFFLFLHTYQVHNPYLPPDAYRGLFSVPIESPEAMKDAAAYDAEIRYADHEVGGFIDALDRMGLGENTLVIVTSDHGEEFGEHGRRLHGTTLHDETLHVPLLLRAPGLLPAGQRRSGPMSIVDLMPTVLALLKLPSMQECDGTSRVAHLVDGTAVEPLTIFHEATAPFALTYGGEDQSWIPNSYAVTKGPTRVIRVRTHDGTRCEAFDLEKDPGEHAPRDARSSGNPVASLCDRLDRYEAVTEAERDKLESEPANVRGADASPTGDPLSQQRLEKLRALGYLQ